MKKKKYYAVTFENDTWHVISTSLNEVKAYIGRNYARFTVGKLKKIMLAKRQNCLKGVIYHHTGIALG